MSSVAHEIAQVLGDVLDKGPRAGTWPAAVDAGLTAVAAPKELGGEGLGFDALAVMLRELGRRAHDLPVWETLGCGLMTTLQAGSPEVQQSIVPRIVSGELQIAPALSEVGAAMPETPATVLADDAVTGTKIHVPVLHSALLLVSVADGSAVFIDPDGP
ncbi:MAG TPA: acyl-CoA dehydrogenase family protein, partial [Aeromicrobium sp.]|nr:acyl-CoA dehydrogenase family protein [Aeromicrobium sp.]